MSPTSLKSDSAELRQEQEAARSGTTQLWEVPPERVQRSFGLHWESEPRKSRNMEPSMSTEVEGEHKERKKIHFAVPASAPTNLDPRQVEMIRRRRPTPATLFRVADQSPEDDQSTHQVKWVVGENGVLKPKRVNQNVYQPPSLKDHQDTATTERFSSVKETTKEKEAPQEEDEEEEDVEKEDKIENGGRGCN
ncbi:protein phosphatase 1 regulatory subunit 1B isoform X3 [Poecilia latipinna]|uniref:protein phosphatase 1 regulatory subunit 1B isoform X3 n=1 Tax=Poecilia latipinna TaxID=48699 RepID=UPI00072DAAF1|nr:PREDICTED: protein phosphatase 1 regulatory subunit 1B isoform X3 [Poecilia latipinna]